MANDKKTDKCHVGINLDLNIYSKLKQIAKTEHRSLASQVIHFVEQGINATHVKFD